MKTINSPHGIRLAERRNFSTKQIDADVLPQLEEVLFTADIGPRAADRIFESVKKELSKDDLEDHRKIWAKIRETSAGVSVAS